MTNVMAVFEFDVALTNLLNRCVDPNGGSTIEVLDNLLDEMLSIDPLSDSYGLIRLLQRNYRCIISLDLHRRIWPSTAQLTNLGMPGELTVVRNATDVVVNEVISFIPTNPFLVACLYFLLEFSDLPKSSSRVKESVQDSAYMFHMGEVLHAIGGLGKMGKRLLFDNHVTLAQANRLEEIDTSINEIMLVLMQPNIFFKKHYDLRNDVFYDFLYIPRFSRRIISEVLNLQFHPYSDLDFTDVWVEFWHMHSSFVLNHAFTSHVAIHGVPPPEFDDVFEDYVEIRTNASGSDVDE